MDSLTGHELFSMLIKEFHLPDNTRRVVIDIPCNDSVEIYFECYGDKKQINLVLEELIKNKDRLQIVSVQEEENVDITSGDSKTIKVPK
jgi:hypothetical protein